MKKHYQIATIIALILVIATATNASTLTVTKTADTLDRFCDSDCSLRDAIAAAADGDTIEFASPLFDYPQVITLSDDPDLRELFIGRNLTINGRGAELLTIRRSPDASAKFRIFNIESTTTFPTVTLTGMTITGGDVLGLAGDAGIGGGIRCYQVSLNLHEVVITGNSASRAGGVHVRNNNTLLMTSSAVTNNIAGGSTIGGGGGVEFSGAGMTMTNTTVSGNSMTTGQTWNAGGVFVQDGSSTIRNSTITNNSAAGSTATGSASGVFVQGGIVILQNTIAAANAGNGNTADVGFSAFGTIATGGYNLIGNRGGANVFFQTADAAGTSAALLDPLLYPLGDYGGKTPTHALKPTSPAIDTGNAAAGIQTDQRGTVRRYDAANIPGTGSDKGAFEFLPMVIQSNDQGDGSLRQAVADVPDTGIVIFDPAVFGNGGTVSLTSGPISVGFSKSVAIVGPGANLLTVQRLGNGITPDFGIFEFAAGDQPPGYVYSDVELRGMKIFYGAAANGGGIYNGWANLRLTGVYITGNTTTGSGGGIFNLGKLRVFSSTIASNESTLATGAGAGIHSSGELWLISSTVSGNIKTGVATANAGGVFIKNEALIVNSTITDNQAGGVDSAGGLVRVATAGTVRIANTIIAANRGNNIQPDVAINGSGSLTSAGYNLIGNVGTVTSFNQPGDKTGGPQFAGKSDTNAYVAPLDPQLSVIGLWGGRIPVFLPAMTSPAVDAGGGLAPAFDARGFRRAIDTPSVADAQGGTADIGAVEYQGQDMVVEGRVVDGNSPVAGATVRISDASGTRSVRTGSFGNYRFVVAGEQNVMVSASGRGLLFLPRMLRVFGPARVDFIGGGSQ